MKRSQLRPARAWILTLAVVVAACESSTDVEPDILLSPGIAAHVQPGLVFITARISPLTSMSALFEGIVVQDAAGCLRLDSPDAPAVVWPAGAGFRQDGGTIRIIDAAGSTVGTIGREFTLGGGEVAALPGALGFTQEDRALAESHCPGKFWIVAPDR